MPPSAPIDSDLTGAALWVLEEESIWLGESVGGGAAVWAEKYTVAAYEAMTGNSNTKFLRIRAKATVIYVLAMTQTPAQAGTVLYWLTCIQSTSNGSGWHENGIAQFSFGQPDYKLEAEEDMHTEPALATASIERVSAEKVRVIGDNAGGSGWHTGKYEVDILAGYWQAAIPESVKIRLSGDMPAWMVLGGDPNGFTFELQWNNSTWVSPADLGDGVYEFGGDGGGSAINTPPPVDMQRIRFQTWNSDNGNTDDWNILVEIVEVDGVPGAEGPPTAFDAAPSNWSWLYTSVGDTIYMSRDAGWHWSEFYTTHGAVDICVDPQLAGAIYYASTEGDLTLMVHQGGGVGAINATLDSESVTRTPHRIARDLNSGRLWFLKSGTTLECRLNGSWSDQKTGLSGATGLHAYLGGKLIFVDGSEIYTSEDYGATVTARKGDWSGYGGGLNAHRMADA